MGKLIYNRPILWDMSNTQVMQELSRLEYHYGCRMVEQDEGGIHDQEPYEFINPYDPTTRSIGLLASGILRTMQMQQEILSLLKSNSEEKESEANVDPK